MIWLTWRQARTQTVVTVAGVAAMAAVLVWLGLAMRDAYTNDLGGCASCAASIDVTKFRNRFGQFVDLANYLLLAVPALLGIFWGAPLIARELETGTHRLVWNQSVPRTRWLAIKLGVLLLIAVAVAGGLSLLLTWAASPWDTVMGNRFGAIQFATRNVAPLGYAAFGFSLGAVTGLLIKRTIPAMAVTIAVLAVIQVAVPFALRQNFQTPITEKVAFNAENAVKFSEGLGINQDGEVWVEGYQVAGAWMLTNQYQLLYPDGTEPPEETTKACFTGGEPGRADECLQKLGLYLTATYHPGDRYWTFQWMELAGYLVLAAAAAGIAFWRVPRVA